MRSYKILILIDQMATGGAGRVASMLLPGLIEKGYEVTIALDNVNAENFYPIPETVKQVYLPLKGHVPVGLKQLKLIMETRRIAKHEHPDVIIAVTFFPFFYAYYGTLGMGIPIIAYDHTSFARNMGRFVNWIRYSLYGKAAKLAILTEKDRRILGKKFPHKEVVYNPLTYPISKYAGKRRKTVLCAGRLDSWDVKGFDRIIKIWSHIAPKHPDWLLQIAGSGSKSRMEEIKKMAQESGVEDQIEFLGQVYNMPALYSVTSIFALPSRIEGFPMVLLEAMSQGCVCCSFEMGGAVNEMMSPKTGPIVKDGEVDVFEQELIKLINQYPAYDSMQESGYNDAARFTSEKFYVQWDKMIRSVL